jgi:autotransporter-associated beta strand protein
MLVPGSTHNIIIGYYQGGGGASMFAKWDLTGGTDPNAASAVFIPASAFSYQPPGFAAVTKNSSGTLTFAAGSSDSDTGPTTVNTGTLQVDGTISNSPLTIAGGATLDGTGTVAGLSASSGSIVSPGDAAGAIANLNTGDLLLPAGSVYEVDLGAATCDSLSVGPGHTVTLGGTLNLNLPLSVHPALNQVYTLINNTSTNPISGTFAGLAEGATITLNNAYILTVSYTGGPNQDSAILTVTRVPGPIDHFSVAASPGSISAGNTVTLVVTAYDAGGYTDVTYAGSINFSSTDGHAILPLAATLTNGVGTLVATLATAGSQTITAADSSLTMATGTSNSVAVAPGSATHLAFLGQPGDTTAGATIAPSVEVAVEDADNNVVTTDSSLVTVTLDSNPGGGTLSGTVTMMATSGVAAFSTLSLDKTGTGYTLTAADGSLAAATSSAFAILPGAVPTVMFQPVAPSPRSTAVSAITITFNEPVLGFTFSDLHMVSEGIDLLPGSATLTSTDQKTWTLGNLSSLTDPTHRVAGFHVVLDPSAAITDVSGTYALATGASTSFIEVDPALSLSGATLTVPGTSNADTYAFTPGPVNDHAVLNGVTYSIDTSVVNTVNFQGNGGNDSATLNATGSGNTATLMPGAGTLAGAGYTASASGGTTLVINAAGSSDIAYVQVPSGAVFAARPGYAYVGLGAAVSVLVGFPSVQANAAPGSSDSAYLYDNGGTNVFAARPGYAYLSAGSSIISVVGFQTVQMAASAGSTDSGYLYDRGGSNTFAARPGYAYLSAGGTTTAVLSIQTVEATAAAGSTDSGYLYDSGGSNTFAARPGYAYLVAGGTTTSLVAYQNVQATAAAGTSDRAYLYDATGSNTFAARPGYAYLSAAGTTTSVVAFQSVQATAAAGTADSAYLFDVSGSNSFFARPGYAYLSAGSTVISVIGFQSVQATAAAGTSDKAHLYDVSGVNTFVGQGTTGSLSGPGYVITVNAFSPVTINGAAGATNRMHTAALDYLFGTIGNWESF